MDVIITTVPSIRRFKILIMGKDSIGRKHTTIVELGAPSSAHHLHDIKLRIFANRAIDILISSLDDNQMSREVDANSQSACSAK